jgi:hypothetical protein
MRKTVLFVIAAAGSLAFAVNAEPVKLTKDQLDNVVAGAITTTTSQVNGGGNTPNGQANGVPTTTISTNPAGSAPPGQNK